MRDMETLVFRHVDLYVGGDDLALTNLTGHPSLVIPHGTADPTAGRGPGSLKFTGRLFGEDVAVGRGRCVPASGQ